MWGKTESRKVQRSRGRVNAWDGARYWWMTKNWRAGICGNCLGRIRRSRLRRNAGITGEIILQRQAQQLTGPVGDDADKDRREFPFGRTVLAGSGGHIDRLETAASQQGRTPCQGAKGQQAAGKGRSGHPAVTKLTIRLGTCTRLTMRLPSSVSKSASIERLPRLVEWK